MSDSKHDPVEYEAKILHGFHELHIKTCHQAEEIVSRFRGENPSCTQVGLTQLNELGLLIAKYIEETDDNQWPRQVLNILGKTMRSLTEAASEIKNSAKAFDVVDLSFQGIVPSTPDVVH